MCFFKSNDVNYIWIMLNVSLGSSLEIHVILTHSRVSCKFNVCVDRFICKEKKVNDFANINIQKNRELKCLYNIIC